MSDIDKKFTSIGIKDELTNSYLDYAMSVIIGRALPDVRDGLKPVHRRVLYAMHLLSNNYNKPYKKSARIVGDVIGKYHPHGDAAVYDAIVRLSQNFSMRYVLIDGQGNFGSIDGDSAAAMRYTEIRMSKISNELLKDLDKNTVNFIENYDGTELLPEVMPSRIPNLLINGSSGIAVGMATNIPPHNIVEVIDGCLAYIDNESITIEKLLEYIKGPDFPTAAIIYGKRGIVEAYKTGKGIIQVRAKVKIKIDKNCQKIIISEIPYQVNKSKLIKKIAELSKHKRLNGILDLRDESDKDGIRIIIEIKRNFSSEIILNNLYSLTQLQISYGINMVALCNSKPKLLNLKDIISYFLRYRKEIIIRRTTFELNKIKEKVHILEGLAIALNNIDTVINLIQKSSKTIEAKNKLIAFPWRIKDIVSMIEYKKNFSIYGNSFFYEQKINDDKYFLTEKQAQSILDLKLHKLTGLEYKKILDEYNLLVKKSFDLFSILNNKKRLIYVVKEELINLKEKYNDLRRTKIIEHEQYNQSYNSIVDENIVIILTNNGYIRYFPLTNCLTQKRGGKGKSYICVQDKNYVKNLLVTNINNIILCFSNYGKLYRISVHKLSTFNLNKIGKPIVNLLNLKDKEKITSIFAIKHINKLCYLFMATSMGIVKKVLLKYFLNKRHSGITAIKLNKNDELIGASLTYGKNEIMLFSKYGKVARFSELSVRSMQRASIGVCGIKLKNNDRVVSLVIPDKNKYILTVTENGFCKKTKEIFYPKKHRATYGVFSIKIDYKNGNVADAVQVDNFDNFLAITNSGTLLRVNVRDIHSSGRNTKGVVLMKIASNENIVKLHNISIKNK